MGIEATNQPAGCCKLPEKSSVLPTYIKLSNRIWYHLIIIEFYCWICACTFPVRSGPSLPSTGLKFIFSTYFRILGMSQAASTVIATSPLSSIYLGNSLKELNVHTSRSKPERIRKVSEKYWCFGFLSTKQWPLLLSQKKEEESSDLPWRPYAAGWLVVLHISELQPRERQHDIWHYLAVLFCIHIINYYYMYSAWFPKSRS